MLKELITTYVRNHTPVGVILDVKAAIEQEIRKACIALGIAGFGLGIAATTMLYALLQGPTVAKLATITAGLVVSAVAGWRFSISVAKLTLFKNIVSTKSIAAAGDAASMAIASTKAVASQGLTQLKKVVKKVAPGR